MKNKVIDFFEKFEGKSITIKELSKQLNENEEELAIFLGSTNNYYSDDRESEHKSALQNHFRVIRDYYDKNGNIVTERTAPVTRIQKGYVEKASSVINKYYKDSTTAANLYLVHVLTGEKIYKGAVDNSDIGGLYSSAFTIHNEYGREINYYNEKTVEQLFSYFPNESFCVQGNFESITVSIKKRNIESTAKTFFIAFVDCIKQLSKQEDFHVVQLCELFEDDDEQDVLDKNAYDYSPLCYSKKDAEAYCKGIVSDHKLIKIVKV